MSWDRGNGYKAYIFKKSIRHCTINHKGQGRKEVITCSTTHWRTLVTSETQKPPKIGKTAT